MTHLSGEGWPASYDSLSRCRELTGQKLEKADLAIFFGHHAKETKPKPKFGGIAHLGVACKGGAIDKRCQLNMWWYNPSVTASVVAHETGHNIGMEHDFYASHKASGCDKTGIMSYGSKPMRWSACSRADFEAHYLRFKDKWCMPESENACQTA